MRVQIKEFWFNGFENIHHCNWYEFKNVEELIDSRKELLDHDGSGTAEIFKIVWRDHEELGMRLKWNKDNPKEPIVSIMKGFPTILESEE